MSRAELTWLQGGDLQGGREEGEGGGGREEEWEDLLIWTYRVPYFFD